ncbi:MAG: hypothetical protein ACI825_000133 [Planctomycetota bacterium]|jgi:hypothetical protein|uniref:hypothetical protein n=1 Tax=Patiriisocius sp. Uisw_047 TaxID=3230969 RepID=UPI0039EB99A5
METQEQTVRIYTGPAMIANGLKARLLDMDISAIEKDDHQSGITSGFAIGVPNQVRLFIRQEELDRAKDMIDAYLNEIGEKE